MCMKFAVSNVQLWLSLYNVHVIRVMCCLFLLSHMEQELPTLPEHLSSSPVFSGVCVAQSLVFYVMFCRSLYVVFFCFFGVLFLLAVVLSVLLRFMASDYPIGIFKPFLRRYHTLQGDNSLKSVERFDHMMFVCRFQASR